jgi:hypothetical protein
MNLHAPDPDRPIPFALTPRAYAALRRAPRPPEVIPGAQWACAGCGAAWFGAAPEDTRCPDCAGAVASRPAAGQ